MGFLSSGCRVASGLVPGHGSTKSQGRFWEPIEVFNARELSPLHCRPRDDEAAEKGLGLGEGLTALRETKLEEA